MSSKRILFLTQASAVTRIFPQLRGAEIEASLAENVKGASLFVRSSAPQYIISRPSLPGYRVEDLFAEAQTQADYPQIIILVEEGTPDEARRFMEMGAYDYWTGPLSVEKLIALSNKKTSSVKSESAVKTVVPKIVGTSPALRRALALAKQVAPSKATVLINGESGTGKEMFSKNLHGWSDRASAPFIAINCATLPEHLLESELFGHEKGSFTGAIGKKIGKFELASGGTLLLDEISEMAIALQAKLLRALQEGEIDRVGGTETIKVNVRVIATTNRNLEEWVGEGKFRQDLYFRLNVIPLRLPSLRERGDDIIELANFFIDRYTNEYKLPRSKFSQEATEWLLVYDWPGNVRELQNLMERAVLLAAGQDILPAHFLLDGDNWPLFGEDDFDDHDANMSELSSPSDAIDGTDTSSLTSDNSLNNAALLGADGEMDATGNQVDSVDVQKAPAGTVLDTQAPVSSQNERAGDEFLGALMPLHEVERLMIKKGLAVTSGNRTQAADLLGISVRTLRNKLNEYRGLGLDVE